MEKWYFGSNEASDKIFIPEIRCMCTEALAAMGNLFILTPVAQ